MTLSQIIKLRTDNGRSIIDFLVAVMQDRYDDFRICHRLQAARLLTTYGHDDAADFIDSNTQDSKPARTESRPPRPTKFDTELARVIREDTDDGRSIARFLVNVMEGELRTFKPHHRMSAARELLDRGFGKSARAEAHVRPEPVEGPERARPVHPVENPVCRQPVERHATPNRRSGERRNPGGEGSLTHHSSPLTPPTDDLLDTLHHLPPQRFERTVLDLLENMGYGRGHHVGRTGDGGIDGIIDQDTLGIDRLYVQAKRWTSQVGAPEIRNFSGSLDPHGATRGIFITTSDFTDTARRTAETISTGTKHIRLVNGQELAHLMLTHNIGVIPDTPHHSRKQDKNHHTHHT